MEIKTFHFNPIQVNTYILWDETGECMIVDPGNCNMREDAQIEEFISANKLKVKYIVNTHPHIDHIAGNPWCAKHFSASFCMHEAGLPIYEKAYAYAIAFGLSVDEMPKHDVLLHEGDTLSFGNQQFEVLYTPGHCDGSICLYDKNNKLVITGDLIFELSVGRSDLPTGNENILQKSIKEKILTLPDDTLILSGHGDTTSVGRERTNNPFIR